MPGGAAGECASELELVGELEVEECEECEDGGGEGNAKSPLTGERVFPCLARVCVVLTTFVCGLGLGGVPPLRFGLAGTCE